MKKIILIVTVVVFFIGFYAVYYFYISPPEIIKTNPKNRETEVSPRINPQITFSRKVSEKSAIVDIASKEDGTINYEELSIEENVLTVVMPKTKPFYPQTQYSISITPIGATGMKSRATVITFITKEDPTLDLSGREAEDLRGTDGFEDGKVEGFEFVKDIPIKGSGFEIVDALQFSDGRVEIIARYNENATPNPVEEWLKSRGVDLNMVIVSPAE